MKKMLATVTLTLAVLFTVTACRPERPVQPVQALPAVIEADAAEASPNHDDPAETQDESPTAELETGPVQPVPLPPARTSAIAPAQVPQVVETPVAPQSETEIQDGDPAWAQDLRNRAEEHNRLPSASPTEPPATQSANAAMQALDLMNRFFGQDSD